MKGKHKNNIQGVHDDVSHLRAHLVNLVENQQSVMVNPLTHGKDVTGATNRTDTPPHSSTPEQEEPAIALSRSDDTCMALATDTDCFQLQPKQRKRQRREQKRRARQRKANRKDNKLKDGTNHTQNSTATAVCIKSSATTSGEDVKQNATTKIKAGSVLIHQTADGNPAGNTHPIQPATSMMSTAAPYTVYIGGVSAKNTCDDIKQHITTTLASVSWNVSLWNNSAIGMNGSRSRSRFH